MVSSILWYQSTRATFTLPFTSTPRAAREPPRAALREACQQTRVTHDDGNRLQQYEWPGIRELRRDIVSVEFTVYASTDAGSNISSEGPGRKPSVPSVWC